MEEALATLNIRINTIEKEKKENENKLCADIDSLKEEMSRVVEGKDAELKGVQDDNYAYRQNIYGKESTIDALMKERDTIRNQFTELDKEKTKEKKDMDILLSEKEKENQVRLKWVVDLYSVCYKYKLTELLNVKCWWWIYIISR